jgi:hypothetical protein
VSPAGAEFWLLLSSCAQPRHCHVLLEKEAGAPWCRDSLAAGFAPRLAPLLRGAIHEALLGARFVDGGTPAKIGFSAFLTG